MSNSRLDKLLEMLQNQPDDAFLLYAVGFEYEAVGENEKAKFYYNSILDKHPDYLPAYYQGGLLYGKLGETEQAINLLKQGIELAKLQNDKKTLRELNEALMEIDDEE